ncbi:HTH-type transcriptional regulator GlvR [Enterococcus casseliflavus]|uniref:HTH-type transcriptional regulator GlvR n=1 Tax=Enterococcus casseliflavus TaxID=37734 RepID=A0A6N3ENY2_ENTCA
MFDEEKIMRLNELEMAVYKYIVQHFEEIDQLTIREFSAACHVSTSTILRCITKLGYRGYSELKYAICQKKEQDARAFDLFYDATIQVNTFLKKVNNEDYRKFIQPAVELILSARHVAFSGIGTSGILGTYARRQWGKRSRFEPDDASPGDYTDRTFSPSSLQANLSDRKKTASAVFFVETCFITWKSYRQGEYYLLRFICKRIHWPVDGILF